MTAPKLPEWEPAWPTSDKVTVIRVTPTHLAGDRQWTCPEQVSVKARPGVSPQRDRRDAVTYPPFASVPIGLVRDALYSVLRRNEDPTTAIDQTIRGERREVPAVMVRPVREAVDGYLAALASLRAAGDLASDTVVREFFARDDVPGGPPLEWWGWGLMHVSRDSAVREFHLLRWQEAGARPRSQAALAVYARVAADAICRPDGSSWFEPFPDDPAQPRAGATVRIREIGLLDGSTALLADLPIDEARAWFDEAVPPALDVLAGGDYVPGTHCAECAVRPECLGVTRMPGVLGVAGGAPWTRRFSPGDLAVINVCSWRLHLTRDLGLPRQAETHADALQRGREVHRWLEAAHGRLQPCGEADLPDDGPGAVAAELGWSPEEYRALRPYLRQHLAICPLRRGDAIAAYPEQALTAWDTDADVVASTRTDLVVERPSGFVLRETKTVSGSLADRVPDDRDVAGFLAAYPQAALAVCLMADGLHPVTGAVVLPPVRSMVEVEFLHPEDARVVSLDPADPEVVLAARRVIADGVDRILYAKPTPTAGRWCGWCPVSRWCDAATTSEDPFVASVVTDDVQPTAEGQRSRVALLAWADGLDSATDDDLPF